MGGGVVDTCYYCAWCLYSNNENKNKKRIRNCRTLQVCKQYCLHLPHELQVSHSHSSNLHYSITCIFINTYLGGTKLGVWMMMNGAWWLCTIWFCFANLSRFVRFWHWLTSPLGLLLPIFLFFHNFHFQHGCTTCIHCDVMFSCFSLLSLLLLLIVCFFLLFS